MPRPISATLDLGALRHNLAVARMRAAGSRVFAVIKANAYGHGMRRAAHALREADGYALLEIDAALELRRTGCRQRMLLLEGFFDRRELEAALEHDLSVVVHNSEQLGMLTELPRDAHLDVMLKVNTGMNRLGFALEESAAALEALQRTAGVSTITLMTHFANADDERGVAWQMEAFESLARATDLQRSLANSAALLRYPETHGDWVRPGIMLYGCSPFAEDIGAQYGLRPAMTLASELIGIQQLKPGARIGYGGIFTAQREMRIGIVACGYADGYPRHAPNGTPVSVEGSLTGTVGRVSMDLLCVDLSGLPQARVGSRVVLWGEGNPIERVAAAAGTVGYELMCALAPRVPIVEVQ